MVKVVMEIENETPLVVIYGGGDLGKALLKEFQKENIRVVYLFGPTTVLPVWEKPRQVFFFAGNGLNGIEAKKTWTELTGKKILIGEGDYEGVNARVRIIGRAREDPEWIRDTARKIIKFGMSDEDELLVIGRKAQLSGKGAVYDRKSLEERLKRAGLVKKEVKKKYLAMVVGMGGLVTAVILYFVTLGFFTAAGFIRMGWAVQNLKHQQMVEANERANEAANDFEKARGLAKRGTFIIPAKFGEVLILGDRTADLVVRASNILLNLRNASEKITEKQVADLRLELAPIDADLGFIEGQLGLLAQTRLFNLVSNPNLGEEIGETRRLVTQFDRTLSVLGEIMPLREGQRKTYLVVLQNSAELRPTGGFIGSYALVKFESGKMAGYKIYDIYTADGQLKGHVQPPDEILHYLGQPSWFMRDANWSPDFPLTAKRLEWFLEKETGEKVDGVIGVNLGAVQKILGAVGGISLGNEEEINADNFFEKAEYAAEINFFPGSEQKPQFLAQVARSILAKLESGEVDWVKVGRATDKAMREKDVMMYFNAYSGEKMAQENGWGGTIDREECAVREANCLMVVEANTAANKANYFVKRGWQILTVIDKAGQIMTTVVITMRNESPSSSWPGGVFSDYMRILLPQGAKLEEINLGNDKKATYSAILTADVLKAVADDQFLVFKNKELNLASYGFQVVVPVGEERTVKFSYRPRGKLDFTKVQSGFNFVIIKQPGQSVESVDFELEYPTFLRPLEQQDNLAKGVSVLVTPAKLVYNMDLLEDRTIKVKFSR